MSHLFTCPHCQTKTKVEARYSGQSGQCVTCGGDIQIPEFDPTGGVVQQSSSDGSSVRWIVAAAVLVILLGCIVFAVVRMGGSTMARLASNRQENSSKKNLEKIAEALNAYAADHGTYPPPIVYDANKKAMHSWRVLLLPYLGEQELYDQYNFDLPWDNPANQMLGYQIPTVYQHPANGQNGRYSQSGYYLITGPATLFPKTGPLGPGDLLDLPNQTILVIEGSPTFSAGFWIEPLELDFAKVNGPLTNTTQTGIGGLLEDSVAFATVDERPHALPLTTDAATFRALVTPRGGERLPDDTLD